MITTHGCILTKKALAGDGLFRLSGGLRNEKVILLNFRVSTLQVMAAMLALGLVESFAIGAVFEAEQMHRKRQTDQRQILARELQQARYRVYPPIIADPV